MTDVSNKRHAPATDRNRDPLLAVLKRVLPERGLVLEIASGSGQHAVYFSAHLPDHTWQPTDADPTARESIAAWSAEAALPNLRAPLALDASAGNWPVAEADAVVCINMVHIAPWSAACGLFTGAARVLPPHGVLLLYGPYRFDGAFTAPSNEAFDASLRAQDPAWGVRDVRDLESLARDNGLALDEVIALPANNHCLVFRRKKAP
jgi:hypothetical protein